ncbi:MAG: AI-2E family transporter [Nitrospirales bacterium]|nr:AI-2E family transporter [Nitrospirales bacterium]
MTQQQGYSVAFLIIFILLLAELGIVVSPFLPTILWAIILAQLAYPIYTKVLRRLQGRETLAAIVLTLGVMLLAVAPAVAVIIMGVQESLEAYKEISTWVEVGGLRQAGESLSKLPGIGRFIQPLMGRVIVSNGTVELSILEGSKWLSTYLMTQAGDLAKNAILLTANFFILLFTLFFLFRDGRRLYARLYEAVPLETTHKSSIFHHLSRTTTAVVRGTLLAALAQGILVGLTFALLGLPFPAFLGAVSVLLALLPVGGTALVWGPMAIWLLATGSILKGGILIVLGATLIGLMDNVLYYWITGSSARLPVLCLFFVSVGGMAYFGFIGLFLGPMLLAGVIAAFEIYEEDFPKDESDLLVKTNSQGRPTKADIHVQG